VLPVVAEVIPIDELRACTGDRPERRGVLVDTEHLVDRDVALPTFPFCPSKTPSGCGNVTEMAGNVVNLNRFRKKKLREEKAKQAEINRVRHGRTQAQKDRERADRERAARMLEGKRLEGAGEEVSDGGPPEPDEPSNERP
jgi:hypothetical protein